MSARFPSFEAGAALPLLINNVDRRIGGSHFAWAQEGRNHAALAAATILTATDLYDGVPERASWFSSAMSALPSG